MTERYDTDLMESLVRLSTPQLDAMLRSELEKERPDEHAVRLILRILRKREADYPVVFNSRIDAAWKKYERKTRSAASCFRGPLVRAAAVAVLCSVLLFGMPQEASASGFFDRIAAWSESIFGLFSRCDRDGVPGEYVFRTDHPGLQELYDAVSELGVTAPVVPMWLDETYQLQYYNSNITPITTKILAVFSGTEGDAVIELNVYSDNIPRKFQKDEQEAKEYESNGIIHYIFRNNERWTVVWTEDNIECSLVIECKEDMLYRILDSIYTMED